MEIRMDVYRADEFLVVGAMFTALGQLQMQRDATSAKDEVTAKQSTLEAAGIAAAQAAGEVALTAIQAEAVETRKKTRVKKAVEAVAAAELPLADPAVVGSITPAPVEAPKPTAPPVAAAPTSTYTKADLEDKTRALAKTNFTAAKALLDKFGVKRFGELPTEKYEEYGKAISAL